MNETPTSDAYKPITLHRFAKIIKPDCRFPDDWLSWPPDLFALTSLVMQRTGSYRMCIVDTSWWEDPKRNDRIFDEARCWITGIGRYLADKGDAPSTFVNRAEFSLFTSALDDIKKYQHLDLYVLSTITSDPIENFPDEFAEKAQSARELAIAILQLHALADMACIGLGLLGESAYQTNEANLAHCLANMLLTATGSLSTVDKIHGTVLPKLRTPQQGIKHQRISGCELQFGHDLF